MHILVRVCTRNTCTSIIVRAYAERQKGRTFLSKSDRWLHLSHEFIHLRVMDTAGGVRVALGPHAHVFV